MHSCLSRNGFTIDSYASTTILLTPTALPAARLRLRAASLCLALFLAASPGPLASLVLDFARRPAPKLERGLPLTPDDVLDPDAAR